MPSYEYRCTTCFQTMTVIRSIHDDDPGYECANCKVPMHQMIGGVALKFNGGGWGKDA